MATHYNAIRLCGHEFTLAKGGGMHYIQTVCDTCGNLDGCHGKCPQAMSPLSRYQILRKFCLTKAKEAGELGGAHLI